MFSWKKNNKLPSAIRVMIKVLRKWSRLLLMFKKPSADGFVLKHGALGGAEHETVNHLSSVDLHKIRFRHSALRQVGQ
jgi:hypothetical protein